MNPLDWSARRLIAVRAALTFVLAAMLPAAFAAMSTVSQGWQLVADSTTTAQPSREACVAAGNALPPPPKQRTWYCREKFVTKVTVTPTPGPTPTPTPTPVPTPTPTPITSTGLCAYPDSFLFKVGPDAAKTPIDAKPATGMCYMDPIYGARIVRTAGGMRNDYSRRQAFNADNTLFLAYHYSDGNWFVYDAKTYAQLKNIGNVVGNEGEPQWDPISPSKLKYLSNQGVGGKLYELDVTTGNSTVLADIKSKLPAGFATGAIWTKSEGSPSRDHRYWCLMAEANWVTKQVLVFDLKEQKVLGWTNAPEDPDHVSMSPSGRWCVASYDGANGVVAYSRDDFSIRKKLSNHGEHSDIAVGADGHDVYVSINYDSDNDMPSGNIYAYDIDAGTKTALISTYDGGHATALHFSGKAFDRPGWVLIGAVEGNGKGAAAWMDNKLFAVELLTKRIVMIANHRSIRNDYQDEPHASVSRDFSRIAFTSNWGSGTATDDYIIEMPGGLR